MQGRSDLNTYTPKKDSQKTKLVQELVQTVFELVFYKRIYEATPPKKILNEL